MLLAAVAFPRLDRPVNPALPLRAVAGKDVQGNPRAFGVALCNSVEVGPILRRTLAPRW